MLTMLSGFFSFRYFYNYDYDYSYNNDYNSHDYNRDQDQDRDQDRDRDHEMTMTRSSNTIRRPRPRSWPQTWTRRVVVIPLIVVLLTLRMMTIIRMLAKIILTIWVIWRRYRIDYINNKHRSLVPLFFSSSSTLTFNLFFKI